MRGREEFAFAACASQFNCECCGENDHAMKHQVSGKVVSLPQVTRLALPSARGSYRVRLLTAFIEERERINRRKQ